MIALVIGFLGIAIGLLVGVPLGRRLDRKAAAADRLVADLRTTSSKTPVVTRETLLAMDRNAKARQERLRQTLPRPPDVRPDMFGPRRKP